MKGSFFGQHKKNKRNEHIYEIQTVLWVQFKFATVHV